MAELVPTATQKVRLATRAGAAYPYVEEDGGPSERVGSKRGVLATDYPSSRNGATCHPRTIAKPEHGEPATLEIAPRIRLTAVGLMGVYRSSVTFRVTPRPSDMKRM
jgi:hypothetical protein